MAKSLLEKLKESMQAVLPIGAIIVLLHFTIAPMPLGTLMLMLVGMVMLIVGLTLFSLGTEMAMMPIGEHIGSSLIRSRKLSLILAVLFIFGFIVTAAEPDLQVFVNQVASIPNMHLIIGIAVGVGLFLALAALRILFRWKLAKLLMILYPIVFLIAIFSSEYLAVAFDASAVTTGPITVPFLLAVGAGLASINSGKDAGEDNFGLCGICSIGPIIAVLLLGLFFDSSNTSYLPQADATVSSAGDLVHLFLEGLWHTLGEVLVVIIPILGLFLIFQVLKLKLSKTELVKILVGLGYLLVGLTIFLAGVNKGFMPAAKFLGETMGKLEYNWILIPLCLVIGACVVMAEPAVHVLTKQVEEITNGGITRGMMLFGMALGVGIAMSLGMVRVLFDLSIWWILVPGYVLALLLTRFVPSLFVGIAFDSGGVAAGAMSAAFVLPFTIGVCTAVGGNIITDAFGVVGLIAMMPPITVQIMGVIYNIKLKKSARLEAIAEAQDAEEVEA
ncbi:DUF1538 domain-containing protein [Ruminococcaceae bacterium OttesenSCG-928-A16]|nr:DUF1538 domain-containing protein [Ruminococcaceae bacterium OttesenSCG-928-A16]